MTAFILMTILALPANQPAAPDPVLVRNAKLLALLKSLHDLTPQKLTDEQLHVRIQSLLQPLSLDDTARFALLSYDMISGRIEDDRIDSVYWRGYWVATEKVASSHDDWAIFLLGHIAKRAALGGGELMFMNELREKQGKAAAAAAKKKR